MADWLHLVESVLNSWPLALVVLGLILRKPLARVMNSLRTLRYKDRDRELGLELHELRRIRITDEIPAPTLAPVNPEDAVAVSEIGQQEEPQQGGLSSRVEAAKKQLVLLKTLLTFDNGLFVVLDTAPVAIIAWCWDQVETSLDYAVMPLTAGTSKADLWAQGVKEQLAVLVKAGYIDKETQNAMNNLNEIRSRAYADEQLSFTDAIHYARVARQIVAVLTEVSSGAPS